jgi:hypothetical protein
VLELLLVRNQRLIESVQYLERLGRDHVSEVHSPYREFREAVELEWGRR